MQLQLPHTTFEFTALVDTGCSVPLLLREGIVPTDLLQPAQRPIQLGTATGDPMNGGHHGVYGNLILPVTLRSKRLRLNCTDIWAYTAPLQDTAMLIGYPFLQSLRLRVNADTHSLSYHPRHPCKLVRSPYLPQQAPTNHRSCPTSTIHSRQSCDSVPTDTTSIQLMNAPQAAPQAFVTHTVDRVPFVLLPTSTPSSIDDDFLDPDISPHPLIPLDAQSNEHWLPLPSSST